jgi:hypothetical protein
MVDENTQYDYSYRRDNSTEPMRHTTGSREQGMAKYVLVYKDGTAPASAQERAVLMQAWRTWVGGLGAAVLDPGNPFGPAATITAPGAVSDGSASAIKGYMIFTAASLATATELARGCPHRIFNGGTIEVYETLPID